MGQAYTYTLSLHIWENMIETDETLPQLLIEDPDLSVEEAFNEAHRLLKGATLANTFLTLVGDDVRDEVTAYLAEAYLGLRPVTVTYALQALGHWDSFKANVFKCFVAEEELYAETADDGLPECDLPFLQAAGTRYRELSLAA